VFAPCQRCEAANELERLQALVLMGARVVNDFLPNIGRCALQDYGALNQFLLEAEKVNGDAEPH
jgi:hypothetical protein